MTNTKPPLTPEEFAAKMRAIYPDDTNYEEEAAHRKADDLLCKVLQSLGYGEGVKAFKKAAKWYA